MAKKYDVTPPAQLGDFANCIRKGDLPLPKSTHEVGLLKMQN